MVSNSRSCRGVFTSYAHRCPEGTCYGHGEPSPHPFKRLLLINQRSLTRSISAAGSSDTAAGRPFPTCALTPARHQLLCGTRRTPDPRPFSSRDRFPQIASHVPTEPAPTSVPRPPTRASRLPDIWLQTELFHQTSASVGQ